MTKVLSALRSLDPVFLLLHVVQEVQYMNLCFKKLTHSYHFFHHPSLTALVQIQGDKTTWQIYGVTRRARSHGYST